MSKNLQKKLPLKENGWFPKWQRYEGHLDHHPVRIHEYLPADKRYYRPVRQGYEDTIAKRMELIEKLNKGSGQKEQP